MDLSKFTPSGIIPELPVFGQYQRFAFSENSPSVKLQAYSKFAPTTSADSVINIESRNSKLSGFRWKHTSKGTDTNSFGSFKFQRFVSDNDGTDIFGFDGANFNIYSPLALSNNIDMGNFRITNLANPSSTLDAVNVAYIDALRLSDLLPPTSNVSFNSKKITNLATPTVSTDAATKGYVDGLSITLTGDVTGSGSPGSSISTTIASTLNQIPVATGAVNINSQNIVNVGNLGIGVSSPTIDLQFANTTDNCKICLSQTAANSFQVYGFGVNTNILKYSVPSSSAAHVFYCGASSTTSTELFRIAGGGYATVSGGTGRFYSRVPSVHISLSGGSTTTTPTGSWVKLNGTTVATSGAVQFTTSSNRITFSGSDLSAACVGMVSASAVLSLSIVNSVNLAIYKNGTTLIIPSFCWATNTSTSIPVSISIPIGMVSLSPGDYL